MKKRLLSIITALTLIAGMFIPMSGVQAATGISHELEVSLMAALGIVPGYPDSYTPDATIKQSEFIKYAYRAVGSEVGDPSPYIAEYGWGDGSADITVGQASQVIIKASGYSPFLYSYGNDSYKMAQSIGIMAGASKAADAALTVETAAVMLYNTLNLDSVYYENNSYKRSDKTIMEDKLNVYMERGIVTANGETSLSGYSKVSAGNVKIGDETYSVGNTYASNLIGCYVKFYYCDDKASGNKILKWIDTDSTSDMLVIYGCDISSISGNSVTYTSTSGGEKTARIDANADIIYNGRLENDLSIEAMSSLTSKSMLIDNNGSGRYNVVIINDYDYYMVDSYTASTYTVNDYSSKQSVSLNPDELESVHIYKDNMETTLDQIAAGQVLAVTQSDDGAIVSVTIVTGSVEGEITSISSDSMVVGGETYDISPAYAGDQLKLGRAGVFYFDMLGKVVRCASTKSATSQYGYLLKYFTDGDREGNYTARILTAEGSMQDFVVNSTVNFNGSKKSTWEVYNLIDAGNNCEQLITYTVNSNNEIVNIKTADEKYIGVDESQIDTFSLHYKGTGRYRKNNMCFNSKYLIDSTTPIFLIPYSGDRDEYSVQDASYLTNNYTYNISVYDIDDYMYASAIVLHENIIEPENLRSKRSMIITNVVEAVDSDGDIGVQLEGYQQGSKVSYFLYNEDMYDNRGNVMVRNLKEGDVVQVGLNTKNNINAVQLLFRSNTKTLSIANGTTTPNSYWEGGTAVFPDLWVSVGQVVDRNNDVLLVDDDGDDSVVSKDPHKLGNVTTYLYESGKISVSNKNEISIGDTVYVHEYQGNLQEVIIIR